MNEPTRAEHLAWCKERALAYVDAGDLPNAFASFSSDMGKHPETRPQVAFIASVGMPMLLGGMLDTPAAMRKFIEGFA
jgi:hypothetical protein